MTSLEKALHQLQVEKLHGAIEKNASFWQSFKRALSPGHIGETAGTALLAAGAAAGTAAVGSVVADVYGGVKGRIQKGRSYKEMLQAAPGLQKRKDADKVQMTFNTLWNLNPDLAKDPLTAGSFVERSLTRADIGDSSGAYVDVDTARNLLKSQPERESPILKAFQTAATSPLKVVRDKEDWDKKREFAQFQAGLGRNIEPEKQLETFRAGLRTPPLGKDYPSESQLELYKAQLRHASTQEQVPVTVKSPSGFTGTRHEPPWPQSPFKK